MFLNPKQDIRTIKEFIGTIKGFWKTFKERAPLLISFLRVLSIIIKWAVFLSIIFCLILSAKVLYKDIQKSKIEAERQRQLVEYQKQLSEAEVNYQKCLDSTVNVDALEREWKQMGEWKEWRCGEYWELYWVDWISTKYPDLCSDYDLESIRFFLNERLQNVEWKVELNARFRCP